MNVIVKKANAKINLFLSVGGIREDGKHFVETVLQKIDLSICLQYHHIVHRHKFHMANNFDTRM